MPIDRLDTFSRVKKSIIEKRMFYDRFRDKHVRFSKKKGLYLHRGLSFGNKAQRLAKQRAAGKEIYKAIVFEHSAATADAVFRKVFRDASVDRPVTIQQLEKLDKALKELKRGETGSVELDRNLTEPEQVAFLTRQAKLAARDNGKMLYSIVAENIQGAAPTVKAAVIKELANYERALGGKMGREMKANLESHGLALCSERDSIVRTRTVNLLKMLDPSYRTAPLSDKHAPRNDTDRAMGAIRDEFNSQNVHADVDGKSMTQGMRVKNPSFIPLRDDCFEEEAAMVHNLMTRTGQPEMLVQSFFLPWQDVEHRSAPVSAASTDGKEHRHRPGKRLFNALEMASHYRKSKNLPPMKAKILINDPAWMIDDRSPRNMDLEKLKAALRRIDPEGVEVEVWTAKAAKRDSHHKKMSVAVGSKNSSGVLVLTGNHDTSTMLDSGIKLPGRDAARQQRKQFDAEVLRSGKLAAHNLRGVSVPNREKESRKKMEQALESNPPALSANDGNTVMTHQRANPTLKNQFRLGEPYALMKSAIRSAKSSVRLVMPYFQILDFNEEIKGALARGVNVDLVLSPDEGGQEYLGQSNRDSAEELASFRKELAAYKGDRNVGKLNIGWTQQVVSSDKFNPMGSGYAHQKYMNVDNEVTLMGSFNADYQSMHSAEQMVMVRSDTASNQFGDYMTGAARGHRPGSERRNLKWSQKRVRSYVGVPSYRRLGLDLDAAKPLPPKAMRLDDQDSGRQGMRFESIDESVDRGAEQEPLRPIEEEPQQ